MAAKIKVQGSQAIQDGLKELGKTVSRKVIVKGLRDGAKINRTQAVALAPVRSGAMKRALKVRAGKRRSGVISILVSCGKKLFVGPLFYAGFVVFGHRAGGRKLGDGRKIIKANDFITRAFNATKGDAVTVIERSIADGVEKAVNNLKVKA